MNLITKYHDWLKSIGTTNPTEGASDSDEWVELHFKDPNEYVALCRHIEMDAMRTCVAEGDLLRLPMAIFNYTFRFATHLEAEKNMPKLD